MIKKVSISATLIIAIIIVINLVGSEYHIRFDLTEDREYTLSKATGDILDNLEDPITVKAYFSENLPPQFEVNRQGFQEALIEYANLSDGKVIYEFINPNENEATEKEATEHGIQPLVINVREKDQVKNQKAFMGARILLGEKEEVIPFVQPGAAMEYALSTAIKKLTVSEKPLIGFLQGHGEAPLSEMNEARQELEILYTVQEVTLSDSTDIPPGLKSLAIIRPTDTIPYPHLQRLDNFMAKGGRVLVAINRVHGDLQNSYGVPVNIGLEIWLRQKGIEVEDNFIVDWNCISVGVQQQSPFGLITTSMKFPYLPQVSKFANHPITQGLEAVIFQFVSTVNFTGDTTKRFTPIVFTSEQSGVQQSPVQFDINRQWTEADFPQSTLPVAAVLEGKLAGEGLSKMVVIGDGDFPINGPANQARRLQPDNVNLLVNSIDWLSDDTGLIDLRTKGANMRPIRALEDTTKAMIKYGNFLLPVLLAVGYGLVRTQRNKIRKYKRMSENYEQG